MVKHHLPDPYSELQKPKLEAVLVPILVPTSAAQLSILQPRVRTIVSFHLLTSCGWIHVQKNMGLLPWRKFTQVGPPSQPQTTRPQAVASFSRSSRSRCKIPANIFLGFNSACVRSFGGLKHRRLLGGQRQGFSYMVGGLGSYVMGV